MEMQAEAERKKRAQVLESEGKLPKLMSLFGVPTRHVLASHADTEVKQKSWILPRIRLNLCLPNLSSHVC